VAWDVDGHPQVAHKLEIVGSPGRPDRG
jgi:hypothetical protein